MTGAIPGRIVLATANPGKTSEIRALLAAADLDIELVARPSEVADVEEDAPDLEGNARLKALALVDATGLPALADDTGLEVDALDGLPGVHSARYAGPEGDSAANIAKLLAHLDGLPDERRTARFRTVVLLRCPDGTERVAHGSVEGRITTHPAGEGGFGYDSVFIPDPDDGGDGRTFAEMDPAAKDRISHRGRALRALVAALTSDTTP